MGNVLVKVIGMVLVAIQTVLVKVIVIKHMCS